MNNSVKLYSKNSLYKNTFRLFFGSFLSFFLRFGLLCGFCYFVYYILKSEFLKNLSAEYGSVAVKTVSYAVFVILFFGNAVFCRAVSTGEKFMYFKRADGEYGSVKLLFKFLSPKKSFKIFGSFLKTVFLRFLWCLYYFLPGVLCLVFSYFIFKNTEIGMPAFLCVLTGSLTVFIIGLRYYNKSGFRYSAVPFYIALSGGKSKNAFKKSIFATDGALQKYENFKLSFTGWFLLCFLIFPLVYVVPFYKLSKTRFIRETVNAPFKSENNTKSVVFERLQDKI